MVFYSIRITYCIPPPILFGKILKSKSDCIKSKTNIFIIVIIPNRYKLKSNKYHNIIISNITINKPIIIYILNIIYQPNIIFSYIN